MHRLLLHETNADLKEIVRNFGLLNWLMRRKLWKKITQISSFIIFRARRNAHHLFGLRYLSFFPTPRNERKSSNFIIHLIN